MGGRLRLEGPVAVIPEWLLDADVSDRATRLYALLHRYAGPNGCFPARRSLAQRMRCSVDSVDRALRELVEFGALEVSHHYTDDGRQTANDYRLRTTAPPRGAGRTGAADEGRTGAADEGRTGAAQERLSEERQPEDVVDDVFLHACGLIAEDALRRREDDVGPVGDHEAWMARTIGRLRVRHGERATTKLTRCPSIDPLDLATWLEPTRFKASDHPEVSRRQHLAVAKTWGERMALLFDYDELMSCAADDYRGDPEAQAAALEGWRSHQPATA